MRDIETENDKLVRGRYNGYQQWVSNNNNIWSLFISFNNSSIAYEEYYDGSKDVQYKKFEI